MLVVALVVSILSMHACGINAELIYCLRTVGFKDWVTVLVRVLQL